MFSTPMMPMMLRPMTAEEERHVVYHEAGHAVAAYLEGDELASVRITAVGGESVHRPAEPRWTGMPSLQTLQRERRRRLMKEVTILLAAIAAERIETGKIHPASLVDRTKATALLHGHTRRWQSLGQRLGERSDRMMRAHWPAVKALAEALLVEREMDGGRARAIITAALA